MTNSDKNIKNKIKERYGKIAVFGNSDSCCMPSECCSPENNVGFPNYIPQKQSDMIQTELAAIPSIIYFGCGMRQPHKVCPHKGGGYGS